MKAGDLVTFSAYGKARKYNKNVKQNTHGVVLKLRRVNTSLASCDVMWFPTMEVRDHWREEIKHLKQKKS